MAHYQRLLARRQWNGNCFGEGKAEPLIEPRPDSRSGTEDMRNKTIALGVLIVIASFAPLANADSMDNIVVNGTFQTAAPMNDWGFATLYGGSDAMPGWHIEGSIDVCSTYFQAPPSGGNSIDLSGDSAGLTSQVLYTVPAPAFWTIDFYLAANAAVENGDRTLQVTFGSNTWTYVVSSAGATTNLNTDWQHITISNILIDSSPTTLSFMSLTPGFFGPVIAGISVVKSPMEEAVPTVPEPTSILMLGSGLFGLAGLARWKRFSK